MSPLFFSEYPDANEEDANAADEDEPLNMFFEDNGFGSTRLINNLGSTFIFLAILLVAHIVQFALIRLKICSRVTRFVGSKIY